MEIVDLTFLQNSELLLTYVRQEQSRIACLLSDELGQIGEFIARFLKSVFKSAISFVSRLETSLPLALSFFCPIYYYSSRE